MNLRILALAALLCAPAASRADSREYVRPAVRPLGLLLRFGLDFGGDRIAKATYSDGTSADVTAGGLVTLAGGLLFHPSDPYAIEATVGYKVDNATAKNGEIKFQRFPVELIVSYVAATRHRIGLGPTLHLSPKATCSVTGICTDTIRFSNAIGAVGQYVYAMPAGDHGLEFGLRYTGIRYKPTIPGAGTVDGSSFGVFVGGWI